MDNEKLESRFNERAKIEEANDKEFAKGFKDASEVDTKTDEYIAYTKYISPLATKLRGDFNTVRGLRRAHEQRWLKDLRQYKSEYDPEVQAKIHPLRSKAFIGLTRTKVKTISARETDLLFPGNGEKNFELKNTPIPKLGPEMEQALSLMIQQQTGEVPPKELLDKVLFEEAKDRAEKMQKEIEDQLAELKWRDINRRVIHSGNLYGTGVLKGPMAKEKVVTRWVPKGDGKWAMITLRELMPYAEFVPLWDIYPDMIAKEPEDLRFVFQRYIMPRNKLWELTKRKDFSAEAIAAYMRVYQDGDANLEEFETELETLGVREDSEGQSIVRDKRYELLEFWGFLSRQDLEDQGVKLPENFNEDEIAANIWLLGDMIIKAIIAPIGGVSIPYHFYYFLKDETSIFGEGVPVVMRHTQSLVNACIRAMVDNAAYSAGPVGEVNIDLLHPKEDPRNIYPMKMFIRKGQGANASSKAVNFYNVPNNTAQMKAMLDVFMTLTDEETAVPRFMWGETTNLTGAGRTATGLSMLMGAANVTLKELVKNYDDGITKPFVRAIYHWNMELNPKPEIKGDFEIVAKGSTSLIAKEVRAEQISNFLAVIGQNPSFLEVILPEKAVAEIAKAMDVDELGLLKSQEQLSYEREQNAKVAAEMQQHELRLAEMKIMAGRENAADSSTRQLDSPGMRPGMERLTPEQLQGGEIPEVGVG